MARYIDADLLLPDAEHKGRYDVVSAYDIANTPSADVRENVRGEWIDWNRLHLDGTFCWHRACSICGYERNDDNPDKDTNFCPNCGADMRY